MNRKTFLKSLALTPLIGVVPKDDISKYMCEFGFNYKQAKRLNDHVKKLYKAHSIDNGSYAHGIVDNQLNIDLYLKQEKNAKLEIRRLK
jgi:hypothetical protein